MMLVIHFHLVDNRYDHRSSVDPSLMLLGLLHWAEEDLLDELMIEHEVLLVLKELGCHNLEV